MIRVFSVLLFLSCAVYTPILFPASDKNPTPVEVITEMESRMRASSMQGTLVMKIETPHWKRSLSVAFWILGSEKACVKISAPPKEAGIASLRIRENMWNYFPKVERTVKIPVSLMMQPWMGSDFTNDDMMRATSFVKDYTHSLQSLRGTDESRVWEIVSLPKRGVPVLWGKVVTRVGADYLPQKQEFFSTRGVLVKVLTYSDIQMIGGRRYPRIWKMETKDKSSSSTTITYRDILFDVSFPQEIFSLRNLGR
ncbi:MAG: outer membrane lipoprotein-sorting protein [Candidatus Ratteibacteria bacterium]